MSPFVGLVVRRPEAHLGVVGRRFGVEDEDVLMTSKRLSLGVQEVGRLGFDPYNL